MQSIKTASAAAVGGLAGGGAILLAGPELFVGGATLGVLGAAAAGGSLEAPLAQPAGLCTTPSPARMRNFNNTNMRGTVQFVTNSSLRLPSEPQKRACACSRVRLETNRLSAFATSSLLLASKFDSRTIPSKNGMSKFKH